MLLIPKGRRVERRALNIMKVPSRPDTKNWEGVPHGKLATAVLNEAKERHLDVDSEDWCLSEDNQRMMGVVTFKPDPAYFPAVNDKASPMKFSLGVRHSNMGHYAVSFCVGAQVTVCTNGVFSGQIVLKKKHTPGLDLNALVKDGFDKYMEGLSGLTSMVDDYLNVDINDRDAAYTLMQLMMDGALKNRYVDDVWKQWVAPAHEEFASRNLWSLYNALTEVAKGMTPDIQYRLLTRGKPVLEGIYFPN